MRSSVTIPQICNSCPTGTVLAAGMARLRGIHYIHNHCSIVVCRRLLFTLTVDSCYSNTASRTDRPCLLQSSAVGSLRAGTKSKDLPDCCCCSYTMFINPFLDGVHLCPSRLSLLISSVGCVGLAVQILTMILTVGVVVQLSFTVFDHLPA